MKIALFDQADDTVVATFNDENISLKDAVTAFLKSTGDWDTTGYFGDGRVTYSGEQFVERGLYDTDFCLLTLPEPLDPTHDS